MIPSIQFRPALPTDRRQIRRLLRSCCGQVPSSSWQGQNFNAGFLLALFLYWLLTIGGLRLLLGGLLSLSLIALAGWLNQYLFENWHNYWVIEDGGQLIACARLTDYGIYAVLSDLVVMPNRRRQNMATRLLSAILQLDSRLNSSSPPPLVQPAQGLYLACASELVEFYQRFGFVEVSASLLPVHLKRELELNRSSELMVLKRTHSFAGSGVEVRIGGGQGGVAPLWGTESPTPPSHKS